MALKSNVRFGSKSDPKLESALGAKQTLSATARTDTRSAKVRDQEGASACASTLAKPSIVGFIDKYYFSNVSTIIILFILTKDDLYLHIHLHRSHITPRYLELPVAIDGFWRKVAPSSIFNVS